jgi:hypothetical protein
MVTSSTKTALSLQDGVGVGSDGSRVGEAVGGTSVGTVKFSPVGGSVEVTKRTGASVGDSPATWTQEDNRMIRKKASVNFFAMYYCFFVVANLRECSLRVPKIRNIMSF